MSQLFRDWPRLQKMVEVESHNEPVSDLASIGVQECRQPFGRLVGPCGIYILVYHSIVDRDHHHHWETSYDVVATEVTRFETHIKSLMDIMTPLRLTDCVSVLDQTDLDRAYFVVTFDDGYSNLVRNALPVCARFGIHPTVFVNAGFVARSEPYYRVLLFEMVRSGFGATVADAYNAAFSVTSFSPENILVSSKLHYRYKTTEMATFRAWNVIYGARPWPKAHLDFPELRTLKACGWDIGNHTFSHATLAGLSSAELDYEIRENHSLLEKEGLDPIPWIAFPNGGAQHVDHNTRVWFEQALDFQGVFAKGGVNLSMLRTEWLRIPVSNLRVLDFHRLLDEQFSITRRAMARIQNSQ